MQVSFVDSNLIPHSGFRFFFYLFFFILFYLLILLVGGKTEGVKIVVVVVVVEVFVPEKIGSLPMKYASFQGRGQPQGRCYRIHRGRHTTAAATTITTTTTTTTTKTTAVHMAWASV